MSYLVKDSPGTSDTRNINVLINNDPLITQRATEKGPDGNCAEKAGDHRGDGSPTYRDVERTGPDGPTNTEESNIMSDTVDD